MDKIGKAIGISSFEVPPSHGRKQYKPFILRVPVLLFVCSIALALIGILEYASRTLPHADKGYSMWKAAQARNASFSSLQKRQETASSTSFSSVTIMTSTPSSSTSIQVTTLLTNPNAFVTTASTVTTTAPVVGATNPNAFVDTVQTKTTTFVPITTTAAFVDTIRTTTSTPKVAATTNQDAFVATKSTTSVTEAPTVGATNPNAFVPTITSIGVTVSYSTNPNAFVATASTSVSTVPQAYVPTITSIAVAVSYSTSSNGVVQTISSSYATTFLASSSYIDHTSIKTYMTTELGTSTSAIATTDANGKSTTVFSAVPYTTVRQTSSAVVTPKAIENNNPRVLEIIQTWPAWKIFVGGYCPVFLAVLFKLFWTAIYAKIKLIEPFTRMARPEGSVASETLHTYYLSSYLMPDAIFSMMKGHWLIFWSAVVYLAVGLLAPLSSEVLFADSNWNCPNPDFSEDKKLIPCFPPKLSVDPVMVRLLQGLLAFIAVMTINLMIMMMRTATGLYSDPSSIGAIAALTHHPDVLDDFRKLDDEVLLQDVRKKLGTRRYKLDNYQRSDGIWRYGFVPFSPANTISYDWNDENGPGPEKIKRAKTFSEGSRQQAIWDAVFDCSFLLLLLATMGILIAFFKDSGDNAFNRFFNSNTFGPRFVMTAAGSIISLNFKRLERDAHTLAPYHALSQSPQPASSTILLQRRSLPYSALFSMTYNRHALASSLALIAILSDILVITIAGIPYFPGQIYVELLVCFYITIVILGFMVLGIIVTMIWRRWTPDLPRTPDTILAVMSYVANSRLLDDFDGCERLRSREVEDRVNGLGKRYGYGRYVGVDGQTKWMVDEDCNLNIGA